MLLDEKEEKEKIWSLSRIGTWWIGSLFVYEQAAPVAAAIAPAPVAPTPVIAAVAATVTPRQALSKF